jgi:plasmid stabilization system protein ParE
VTASTPAEKVVDRLERAARQLALMPGMGHERPELQGNQYRVWAVHSYLMIYRYGPKTVTIVRVVHGARDLRRMFKRR